MFRLAIVSIASGMCIANPIYKTKEECEAEMNILTMSDQTYHRLSVDETDRTYVVPTDSTFAFIIEPVIEEDM